MIDAQLNSKDFENKLHIFSSGLGDIYNELLSAVGQEMSSDAKSRASTAFNNRTGKLGNSINFILKNNQGLLTTRKSLNKSNIWYAKFIEYGANINTKKKDYLIFKINGEWKKVKSVRVRPRPFMIPVWNEYWEGDSAKGFKALANALERKMNEEFED